MDPELISQLPLFELVVPAWQMLMYIVLTTVCMLSQKYRLSLIITYCFSLYWVFFLYYGDVVGSFDRYPSAVTLYLVSGLLLIILMLIAAFRE